VSGGCIEGAVVHAALAAMKDKDGGSKSRLLEFGVTSEMAWEVGLACGGQVQVLVTPVPSGSAGGEADVLSSLLAAVKARRSVVLLTALPTGEQRLYDPSTLAHSDRDPAIAQAAMEALATDRCKELPSAGHSEQRLFVQPFCPPVRVMIVGAVHIAQPLSQMAALAGLEVILIDPRKAFATRERFPGVTLNTSWPGPALAEVGLDERCAVITLTHDPKLDDPALEAALRSPAFYIGSLGSGKTHAARLGRLRARGLPEDALARVHGPVGLALGARSPAEIAVSILAQLVAELHRERA
jgi:xanthine dehydrogenase accessory factor